MSDTETHLHRKLDLIIHLHLLHVHREEIKLKTVSGHPDPVHGKPHHGIPVCVKNVFRIIFAQRCHYFTRRQEHKILSGVLSFWYPKADTNVEFLVGKIPGISQDPKPVLFVVFDPPLIRFIHDHMKGPQDVFITADGKSPGIEIVLRHLFVHDDFTIEIVQHILKIIEMCLSLDQISLVFGLFPDKTFPLEPVVHQVFDIIVNLNKAGTTILLVEQNAQMALSVADRAYVIETGRITLSGTGEELARSEAVKKAYLGG